MEWNGKERRKPSTDHDTLIALVQILDNHVENFNKHVDDDKILAKDVRFSSKMVYMGLGALGALEVVLRIMQH